MRSIRLLAFALAAIPAVGCGDDLTFEQPDLPDPALNGVFPASGFTDRKIRVEVSGDATEFTSGATISFSGTGVTAANTALSSPSDLFIDVTIAGDAAVGKRDVIVTDGANTLTLAQAFEVKNPLEVLVAGELEQAGIVDVFVINHDPENPFHGQPAVASAPGVQFNVDPNSLTPFSFSALAFLDADATTMPVVVQDAFGTATVTSRGPSSAVTARAPTPLAPPVESSAEFSVTATLNHRTAFLSFPASSAIWRGTSFNTDKALFENMFIIWLKNGKWAESRGFEADSVVPMAANETGLVVIVEAGNFDTGFEFQFDADEFHVLPGVQPLAEVEPNDPFDGGTAQTIANAETLFTGVLNIDPNNPFFGDDFDVFDVDVTDGQSIRVTTTRGIFGSADTLVAIDDIDFEFFHVENDDISVGTGLFASDVDTGILDAGTYEITVDGPFGVNDDPYEMGISISDNAEALVAHTGVQHAPRTLQARSAAATILRNNTHLKASQIHKVVPTTTQRWKHIQRVIKKASSL